MINEKLETIDTVQYRKLLPDGTIDMSPEGLILETNNNPSIWQRFQIVIGNFLERIFGANLCVHLGLYKCAGDAMMNWGIQQLAISIHDTYNYISVGTNSGSPNDYTLNELLTPVMVRAPVTKGYDTTYIENDTAVFQGIINATGAYTIVETGIHDTLTGGHMGARQTSCSVVTTDGVPFGMIWRVCIARV